MMLISGEVRHACDVELNLLHTGEFLGKSMFTDENVLRQHCGGTGSGRSLSIEHCGLLVGKAPVASRKFDNIFDIYVQEVQSRDEFCRSSQLPRPRGAQRDEGKPDGLQSPRRETQTLSRSGWPTGIKLYKEVGLMISKKLASGPLGGDQAIEEADLRKQHRADLFSRSSFCPSPPCRYEA